MSWFYAEAGQQIGPVSDDEFQSLQASGRIRADTLVWREGMASWVPLSSTEQPSAFGSSIAPPPTTSSELGVSDSSSATSNSFCTQCGRQVPLAELVPYGAARVCVNCKDAFFQRVREQGIAATPGVRRFGGFWIRFAARIIDSLLIWAILLPILLIAAALGRPFFGNLNPSRLGSPDSIDPAIGAALGGSFLLFVLLSLAVVLVVEGWFVANRGGSPGKLALGLRLIRPGGERLTFWRAIGRYFAYILSGMILYIGYIMAAFDSEKRALHDYICDTRVVYK